MKILVLGKDATLFRHSSESCIGDTRDRHIYYVDVLRKKYPDSEIRIVTYTPKSSKNTYEEVVAGLKIYGTASTHRSFYVLGLWRYLIKFYAEGWRPDVITVQTPWEEGVVGCIAAKIFASQFIPQLHFDLFSREWLRECAINKWRKFVARFVIRQADYLRVVSQNIKDSSVSLLGLSPERVHVIPVGVNFSPSLSKKELAKRNLSERLIGKPVILFVGRFCKAKNLHLFAEIAKDLLRQHDVMFVMVGDGEEFDAFNHLIVVNQIESNFLLLGSKRHADLPEIYAAADIFMLTSSHEGFGRVILEAQLSGVPVVSADCAGPKELIQNNVSGFLISGNNVINFVDAVSNLLTSPDKVTLMTLMAKENATKNYSLESLTKKIIALWALSCEMKNSKSGHGAP